jgi:DNA-binding NarL/FixJ family response regulator
MQLARASVFVIDPDAIYRRGMMSCLRDLSIIDEVDGVDEPTDAWEHEALSRAQLVLIDMSAPDALGAIKEVSRRDGCRILATAVRWRQAELMSAVGAGALGLLCKADLSEDALVAHVRAALYGAGVVPAESLAGLVEVGSGATGRMPRLTGLTSREQVVLKLIADGRLIREVASELSYSERTVKMVLSAAVGKLGARSRSQAVAYAVREGLI